MRQLNIIILSVCLALISTSVWSQKSFFPANPSASVFQKLTSIDGLSQGSINIIVQDKNGFIWIGTNDGLNRYDGYNINVYRNNVDDTLSISCNQIRKILIDNNNILWIGTEKGLNRFDPRGSKFQHHSNIKLGADVFVQNMDIDENGKIWIISKDSRLISYSTINGDTEVFFLPFSEKMKYKDQGEDKIFIDSGSNIWLGLKSGGLHRFNPENKKFESFDPGNDIPANIDNFKITSIIEDAKGNLWIGTYLRSVVYFDVKNHDFIYLKSIRIFNDTIFAITDICLQNDTLWIGTFDIGLVCYDLETKQSRIYNAGHSIHDLLYRNVKTLFVDRTNNLWIGSNGKGINILNHYQKPFYYLNDSEENPINISFSSIRSIYQDEDKNVWIGGYMGFEKLNLLNATTELIKNTIIYSICPDPRNKNILWLGTEGGGIYSYNKVSNDFERFVFDEYIESNINVGCNVYGLHVYDIEFKNDSLLFAGTNLGLVKINTITNSFHIFGFESNYTNSLPVGKIISIDFDSNGKLMISSGTQGIFEYNEKDNIFVRPFSGKGNFPNTYVFCIHESKNGIFWLGTDWGLCCMDTKKETYTYFTKDDGLPNNVVYAVLEDDYDNLWLSTNQGISKYNLTENKFNNFDDKDGLPGNEFNSKAFFQSDDYFYFGGVDGLVIFNPDEIFINSIPPKLAITQLKKYSNKGIDKSFAIKDDKIIIEPHENIVEIGFSTFDFIDPLSCRYMYRIQGYSDNWIELGNMHNIFLNDLNPGNYNLEIRASNSDGIWTNSPKQIELQVIPKFIETIYFKLIIFLVSLLIVIAVYFERMSIVKRQKKDLEIRIHKKTKELLKANKELNISNSTKDRFLSIIAHDLKNPFNSLLGFSEILQEEWFSMEDSKRLELVSILHKTLQETYQLLINLLDWSRLQRNKLKWQPEMVDLHEIVQNTYAQTNPLAVHKEISIIVLVNPNTQVYVDKEMISTILRNLISNAIKFTKYRGRIMIYSLERDNMISCCVEDSGVGIEPNIVDDLFKHGEVESTLGTNGEKGTGLGLILCKELIQINKGEIRVKSKIDKGSTFCISLPINKT